MCKIWPNLITEENINEAPLTWSVLPLKNQMMKIKIFYGVGQSNDVVLVDLWHCETVTGSFLKIFICKPQQIYHDLIFKSKLWKSYISLFLTLVLIIFTSYCTCNYVQKFFYRNFLCLKVFELNLKLCCYNLFQGPGANHKWSKQGFHGYIVCHASERQHGGVILEKVEQMFCRKENFDGKWRITVCNWIKVKLLYYSRVK